MTLWGRLIGKALAQATPSVEDCARELGLSSSALRRYRLGNRAPPRKVLQRLVALLRRRAAVMVSLAAELESTIRREDEDV